MNRWDQVPTRDLNGSQVKMYRERFTPVSVTTIPGENLELDHYAAKYLGSEVLMYQVMDTNWTEIMEARGDMSRLKQLKMPVSS